ncbi:MAG TPA: DUF1501 domain-containing protein [Flavilitoribacter sp.]|nr:DUF1501 domain-containing protein [Flavilitoribacter sp.]
MKRRQFIRNAGAAVSIPMLLNGFRLSALSKPLLFNGVNDETDRVLVLIQLNGGNDGLNMVLPLDQYASLHIARPNIIIPESAALQITDTVGLHPEMTGMNSLYHQGKLEVIQSVGYPNQNRSHFRSMEIFSTGSPADEFWNTGWMGRYFDDNYPGFPEGYPSGENPDPFAITMGYSVSATCQGQAANFSMTLNDPFNLSQIPENDGSEILDTRYGEELAYLLAIIRQTNRYSERIELATNNGHNMAQYPSTGLARQLKNIALLISGGLQTKVYVASLGGFDTHAGQVEDGDPTSGSHAELLKTLSDAVKAFQDDLQAQGLEERVIGMTFSEFGRQIRSNESLGTDHGTAAPLIMFGSCVKPQVYGDNPEIPFNVDVQEALPMQNDFRDVYGSILMDWFGVPESDVRTMMHPEFTPLPIVSCSLISDTRSPETDDGLAVRNFPNPFQDWSTIAFTSPKEDWVRLSVFDAFGSEVAELVNKKLSAGEHEVRFEGRNLPAGSYYYRLMVGNVQKTKLMIKAR